ncbi:putative serine protease HhoA precursor [compost metagenome]
MPKKFLPFNTALPEVGDKVYAIGSPEGLENTVSEGIVSGIRSNNGITVIQHTADITHGSSGGVLLNEYGEAIGITSGGVAGTNIEYAVPMMYVQQGFDTLK